MTTAVNFNVHDVFLYLRVDNANKAIAFYQQAFGAQELFRLTEPGGRVGHAEIRIGAATIMLSEEYPEMCVVGPKRLGGTTCSIHLHVDNADAWLQRAVECGGVMIREPTDAFYGERSGLVRDPCGHEWLIGHQIEEVAPEEMQRRYNELMNGYA
jgi:PhnB protein